MSFDEKFIAELKAKNDIVDVVGKYCVLKKRGSLNHWACCPLPGHSERTPSFTVNEAGQFFKCFGCGKGGDVITFVMIMENLDYPSAVKFLAERAGLQLPDDDRSYERAAKDRSDRERTLSLMKSAALFYVHNLREGKAETHREYLQSRGIDAKTATAFGIGASTDMFSLVTHLKNEGFSEEEMVNCGVCQRAVSEKNKGKEYTYDALSGRLIIPIINNLGNVIAFGGRLLEKKPQFAKYKNTKETSLFIKNRTLYNINNLKKERAKGNLSEIIMVEGYMDTISVYQGGFRNVVASMGTSLTVEQARTLKRYADTVLISYDGDGAGQKATVRGLEILQNEGLEVKVVCLPDGLDPDDVIKKYGSKEYARLLQEALPLVDFKIRNLKKSYDLNDLSEKRKYIVEAVKIASQASSESVREDLLRKIGKETGTTYESLKRDADKFADANETEIVKEETARPIIVEKKDGLAAAERFILCAVLFSKPYAKNLNLDRIYFSDAFNAKIADIAREYRDEGKEIFPSALAKGFSDTELAEYDRVLTAGDNVFGTKTEDKYFTDCLLTLRRVELDRQLKELNAVYAAETDVEKRKEIVASIAVLTAKLSSL